MIFTTYFSRLQYIEKQDNFYNPKNYVAISATQPDGFKGLVCKVLAPPYYLLHDYKAGAIPQDVFIKIYIKEVLNQLDVHDMYKKLDGKTLVCWEGRNKFCHRHIVAAWFRKNGYPCEEVQ